MTNNQVSPQPSGAPLGARIDGVDLRQLDDETFAAIHRAWLAHQVLLFPGQQLTDAELIAFSRRFGELDLAPIQETGRRFVEGHPELYVVSNVIENGVPIGSLGAGEAVWHTDMSYQAMPPKASMLYALEVPPAGGNTSFCSMYDAWERLPGELQQRVRGASLKHDGTYNSGGYLREGSIADRRSAHVARARFTRWSAGTPRPAARTSISAGAARLDRGAAARRVGGAARSSCGRRPANRPARGRTSGARRSRAVGQPLHHASARCVRRRARAGSFTGRR